MSRIGSHAYYDVMIQMKRGYCQESYVMRAGENDVESCQSVIAGAQRKAGIVSAQNLSGHGEADALAVGTIGDTYGIGGITYQIDQSLRHHIGIYSHSQRCVRVRDSDIARGAGAQERELGVDKCT